VAEACCSVHRQAPEDRSAWLTFQPVSATGLRFGDRRA
jgi:hypothetical protein